MKAWGSTLDPNGGSKIRFLADPSGAFSSALELDFDATAAFGNRRSKRYALVMKDGKVASVHVEEAPSNVDASAAENVLG